MSAQENLPTIPSKPLPYLTQESVLLSCVPCYPLECPKRARLLLSRKLVNIPHQNILHYLYYASEDSPTVEGEMVKGWELRDPLDLCVRAPPRMCIQIINSPERLVWGVRPEELYVRRASEALGTDSWTHTKVAGPD